MFAILILNNIIGSIPKKWTSHENNFEKKNLLFSQKYLTIYVFLHLSNSKKKVGRTDWYFPLVFSSIPNTRWEAPWGTFSVCRFLFYFRFLWFLDRIADYVQNSKKSTIFFKGHRFGFQYNHNRIWEFLTLNW